MAELILTVSTHNGFLRSGSLRCGLFSIINAGSAHSPEAVLFLPITGQGVGQKRNGHLPGPPRHWLLPQIPRDVSSSPSIISNLQRD